jgi:hypothetical protein
MSNRLETIGGKRVKHTHIFEKEEHLCYVEPHWCSKRLFAVEHFPGAVHDLFCGTGRVADAARTAGYTTCATDIVNRGYAHFDGVLDVFDINQLDRDVSIVANPPFTDEILKHAISLDPVKMALIWPTARITAAHKILAPSPLARVWQMTPRPAMPPLSYIEAGHKPEGARVEHCWLVFERGYQGPIELCWLRRDGNAP